MRDIITGLDGEHYRRSDLDNQWDKTINVGTANRGENFVINGYLGGTNRRGVWDSADRLQFSTENNIHLELNTDSQVITELVRFDQGIATVVTSVEYGDRLSLDLTAGNYGLSFFVEGDLIDYHVRANFL